jgi:hypothetical protein
MYPLDVITNAARPVTLAGKPYPVRQLKLKEWGELQAWLKAAVPSPVTLAVRALSEAAASGPVPKSVEDALFRQAQEESRRWPPKVGSFPWLRALDDVEGGRAMFFRVALRAGGTELSEDEAAALSEATKIDELGELITSCLEGDHRPPKGVGAATPPSPTSGVGSTSTSGPSGA